MTWDKITFSDKALKAADDILIHPIHKQYYREVQSLVAHLRLSKTPEQLYGMQKRLLSAIQRVEELQQQRENQISGINARRKDVVARGNKVGSPNKAQLWELERQKEKYSREVEIYKQIRRELRSVGDGLLWKAVGYNRGYITSVSDAPGEGNRHLSDSEGLEAELNLVEKHFKAKKSLAILHDLTNVGRVGDLTLIRPNLERSPQVLEVKRSRSHHNQRIHRQKERLQKARRFVQGLPVSSEDGRTKLLRVIDAPLEHHLKKYAEVLFEAGTKGAAGALVEDYLGIIAFYTLHTRWDFLYEIEDEKTHERLSDEVFRTLHKPIRGMFSNKDSLVSYWDSMEKEFTLMDNRTSGAPFSIYPFHPEMAAALICGYMRLFVYCNLSKLTRRFQNEGFQVNIEHESINSEQVFSRIQLSRPKVFRDRSQGELRFSLGKTLMQQVLGEGMGFRTLVDNVVKPGFKGQVEEYSPTDLAFTNEKTIWENIYVEFYMKPGVKTYKWTED